MLLKTRSKKMNRRIRILLIALVTLLVMVGAYSYHTCQEYKNELDRAKIGMMNMTIEVMNSMIENAEENNYSNWNDNIGILDFMLSNLEYADSKDLGDYDAIASLIEKVSEMESPSDRDKESLKAIKKIRYTRTVNDREAKIFFRDPKDKEILQKQ